jgi:hypothetical protein
MGKDGKPIPEMNFIDQVRDAFGSIGPGVKEKYNERKAEMEAQAAAQASRAEGSKGNILKKPGESEWDRQRSERVRELRQRRRRL